MHRVSRAALAGALFAFRLRNVRPFRGLAQAAARLLPHLRARTSRCSGSSARHFFSGARRKESSGRRTASEFSYLERQGAGKDAATELWTMNATTGERKVLVNAATLKEVMQPEKAKTTQATGLGRVQAENYLWAPDGNSLLFIGSNSLVLLDLNTMAAKPIASSEQEIEDPKFSPDSKWISFSRSANLFAVNIASGETKTLTTWRQRGSSEGETGLGISGGARRADGLLVVAGFEEDRLLRDG